MQRRENDSDEESPLSEEEEMSVTQSSSRRKGKSRADGPVGGAQYGEDDDQAGWSVSEYKSRPTQGSPENQRLVCDFPGSFLTDSRVLDPGRDGRHQELSARD